MALTVSAARHVMKRIEGRPPASAMAELVAECERVLKAATESKRRIHAALPRASAPGPTKEDRKTERNGRAARIRAEVFKRADGFCEFCDARSTYSPTWLRRAPEEWHHILGGGDRTAKEAADTTAAVCGTCHDGWEAADLAVLNAAKVWAFRHGFREALAAIEKRIDHVKRLRATP